MTNRSSAIIWLAVLSCMLTMTFVAFAAEISDIVTIFLMLPVALVVFVLFLVSGIWSIVHIFRKSRFRKARAYMPFAVHVLTIAVVATVPFTEIKTDLNYRRYMEKRMAVIAKVGAGELKPAEDDENELIELPREFRRVSHTGYISVARNGDALRVMFYFRRGMLGHFCGFMYSSDDQPPEQHQFDGEYTQKLRLEPNWFWVSAGG